MKKLITLITLTIFIFSSCQKVAPDVKASIVTAPTAANAHASNPTPVPEPNQPFSAKFTYSVPDPNNIFENQAIQFRALGGGIVNQVWTFGNGSKLNVPNPAMSYILHGFYNVTLTVTDKYGNKASSAQQVSILCNFAGGGNHY